MKHIKKVFEGRSLYRSRIVDIVECFDLNFADLRDDEGFKYIFVLLDKDSNIIQTKIGSIFSPKDIDRFKKHYMLDDDRGLERKIYFKIMTKFSFIDPSAVGFNIDKFDESIEYCKRINRDIRMYMKRFSESFNIGTSDVRVSIKRELYYSVIVEI